MARSTGNFLSLVTIVFSAILALTAAPALAQGNSQGKSENKGQGKNKNIGVGNASDGISGRVITNKGVVYTGDPLEISIQFPRGSDLVNDGSVDAYVVIFAPTVSDDTGGSGSTDGSTTDGSTTDGTITDGTTTDSSTTDGSTTDSGSSGTDATGGTAAALSDPIVLPVSNAASSDIAKLFELEQVDLSALAAGTYQLGLVLTNPGGDPLVIKDWYRGLLGLIDVVGLTITDEAVDFDQDGDGVVDDDADGDGLSDDPDSTGTDSSGSSATSGSGT